jgi:RNA recognition motif-containing protein
MKGQAFIAFKDTTQATTAMKELANFVFYDKPMVNKEIHDLLCILLMRAIFLK